jgi:hypothetical protein
MSQAGFDGRWERVLRIREHACSYFALKTRLTTAPANTAIRDASGGSHPSATSSSGAPDLHIDLRVGDNPGRVEAVGQGMRPLLDLLIGEVGSASLDL